MRKIRSINYGYYWIAENAGLISVALDDSAWWSYNKDTTESTAGFFVAFTRAKQRVLFTYCPTRGDRRSIQPLYALLERAGVQTIVKM